MDAPPTALVIGGRSVPVETDYRVWLRALQRMRNLRAPGALEALERLLFGRCLPDPPTEVLRAVAAFARGYPGAELPQDDGPPTLSLEWDLNELILAIRNQSGIDLSYRRQAPFHWWEFLLEARTLCGEHMVLKLAEARGYTGDDPARLKAKAQLALPQEGEAERARTLQEIQEVFYNA